MGQETRETICCGACKVKGVRLYRDYGTFLRSPGDDRCNKCLNKKHKGGRPDWMVPMCMDANGTVWGYTSTPPEVCEWFYALPEADNTNGMWVWKRRGEEGQTSEGWAVRGEQDPDGWLVTVHGLPGVGWISGESRAAGAEKSKPRTWSVEIKGEGGGSLEPVTLIVDPSGVTVATVLATRAEHPNPHVALMGVLALGPYGRNGVSARADAWLAVRGAVPTGLKWDASSVPMTYIRRIMLGEVR